MTSIEWLIKELDELIPYGSITTSQLFEDVLEEAKEMHKQEMTKFANDFWNWAKGGNFDISDAEQYYQETFVSKGSDELEQVVNDYDDDPTWIDDEVEVPQQEISDEEILTESTNRYVIEDEIEAFIQGANWMQEQLKTK